MPQGNGPNIKCNRRMSCPAPNRPMVYTVTIIPSSGEKSSYPCGGASDQEALIYAGKVVEANADRSDPDAAIVVEKDGEPIGPTATLAELTRKAV